MSLILDALKRAERDRNAILSGVGNGTQPGTAPGAKRRGGWRVGAAVALVAMVAAAGWYYASRRPPAEAPAAPQAATPPPAAPAPTRKAPTGPRDPFAARTQPPARPKVIPGTEGMASLDDVAEAERSPDPVATTPPAVLKAEAPPPGSAAPQESSPSASSPQPATEQPAATGQEPEAGPETAPAEPPTTLKQPAQLRRFREMPPAYRADFPAFTVEVHVYDRDPKKRWVLVNGRRYKEGEKLADGPVIREIIAEGLVFDYRGESLIYPLKSWPSGVR